MALASVLQVVAILSISRLPPLKHLLIKLKQLHYQWWQIPAWRHLLRLAWA